MQAVTTVNAGEASKTLMRKPTQRHHGEGRRRRVAKPELKPVDDKDLMVPPGYRRQHVCKESNINTGSPSGEDQGSSTEPPARARAGPDGMAERFVVPMGKAKPPREAGNDRGGKEPQLKEQRNKRQGTSGGQALRTGDWR